MSQRIEQFGKWHTNQCGIIWDWPCDCGGYERRMKAKRPWWRRLCFR